MSEKTSNNEKARLGEFFEYLDSGVIPTEHNGLWWLSFADYDGFRGACIVPGTNVATAVMVAHARGCNGGGQVIGCPLPPNVEKLITPDKIGRLMNLDQCRAFDVEIARLLKESLS